MSVASRAGNRLPREGGAPAQPAACCPPAPRRRHRCFPALRLRAAAPETAPHPPWSERRAARSACLRGGGAARSSPLAGCASGVSSKPWQRTWARRPRCCPRVATRGGAARRAARLCVPSGRPAGGAVAAPCACRLCRTSRSKRRGCVLERAPPGGAAAQSCCCGTSQLATAGWHHRYAGWPGWPASWRRRCADTRRASAAALWPHRTGHLPTGGSCRRRPLGSRSAPAGASKLGSGLPPRLHVTHGPLSRRWGALRWRWHWVKFGPPSMPLGASPR